MAMNNIFMNKEVINSIGNIKSFDIDLKECEYKVYNLYDEDLSSLDINIKLESNTYLVINLCGYINKDITINIKGILNGNNSKCIIKGRFIAHEAHGTVNANLKAPFKSKDNILEEDLKGYLDGGTLALIPILEIDTNEVYASHFATVGVVPMDELFYLQSKGINKKRAIDILKRSFILNPFDKEFVNLLRKEENE